MKNIGILDPKGKYKNPLTQKKYSKDYKELAKLWSKYPAYKNAKEYINIIKKNQVILVVSGTGSGKTVLFPKYALHAHDYSKKIAITLPKQIITRSAAEFSARTLDVELGTHVGYKYRGSPSDSRSIDTKLLYATDGTIVAKLLFDPLLSEFDTVIVDEAHERKVQIDFLLYLLRETLQKRDDLKVIIMSATINNTIFQDYFNSFKFHDLNIGGKTNYEIKSIFLTKKIKSTEYVNKGVEIILNILKEDDLKKKGAHDILFFITSTNEARKVCKLLKLKSKQSDLFCVEVFAGMNKDMQEFAEHEDLYKQNGKYGRKIVVATNVAESSLTIKGIKYVIESGYELLGSYDVKLKGRKLEKSIISHAQAKQRMGRAGRTEPGVCYHLYTKDLFENKMKRFPDPDIKKQDITTECLRLLNTDRVQILKKLRYMLTNFIEPPAEKYIDLAINNLIQYKLVRNKTITQLGKLISELSLEPILAIPLIYSKIYNCHNEVINIVSLITAANSKLEDIFLTPEKILKNDIELRENKELYDKEIENLKNQINEKKKKFNHPLGDHLSLLNLYNEFNSRYTEDEYGNDDLFKWCEDNFIIYNTLVKAKKYAKRNKKLIKDKLKQYKLDNMKEITIEDTSDLSLDEKIIKSLFTGYFLQTATKSSDKSEYTMSHYKKKKIAIDTNSFILFNSEKPMNIFYHELFISSIGMNLNIISKFTKKN